MERTQESVRKTSHAVLLIHTRGTVSSHRPYLESSHSLPAPQRPLKPSARLLLQSRAASGRWRHLRPSLATDRNQNVGAAVLLPRLSAHLIHGAPLRASPASKSLFFFPLLVQARNLMEKKSAESVDELSPCRQSTRAMKSR